MNYSTARRDFEFLESIAELDNQMMLDEQRLDLMRNPTKKEAMGMYQTGIERWFFEHGITDQTRHIANRHGITS